MLNTDATSGTRQLHCYMVKFRFTSLYGNRQIDLDLCLTGSWIPGYNKETSLEKIKEVSVVSTPALYLGNNVTWYLGTS